MEIEDSNFYAIADILKIVDWNKKKLQRYAQKKNIRMIDGRYIFTGLDVKEILKENDNVATKQKSRDNLATRKTPIPKEILRLIKEIDNDIYVQAMLVAIKEDRHLEEFSNEEYDQLQKQLTESTTLALRIDEYKAEISRMEDYVQDYRNNIEYFKKSLDKRAEETEKLLNTINQRNFIEAKREGFDEK